MSQNEKLQKFSPRIVNRSDRRFEKVSISNSLPAFFDTNDGAQSVRVENIPKKKKRKLFYVQVGSICGIGLVIFNVLVKKFIKTQESQYDEIM